MVTDAQEQAAYRRMSAWQRAEVRAMEQRDEEKSGIPVRKVSKAYIQANSRLINLESAFISAGEEIREAISSSGVAASKITLPNGNVTYARVMTKAQMIDAGIWPLMSNGNADRETRLGQVNGDYDKWDETLLQNVVEQKTNKFSSVSPQRFKRVHNSDPKLADEAKRKAEDSADKSFAKKRKKK